MGGPVGKPGGNNKLFFYYSHEYRPTNAAINNGNPIRLRVPTALERAGDFSQTRDNNGNLFTTIRDYTTGQNFADGGVQGKIPANRLYQPPASPCSTATRCRTSSRPRGRTTTTR